MFIMILCYIGVGALGNGYHDINPNTLSEREYDNDKVYQDGAGNDYPFLLRTHIA